VVIATQADMWDISSVLLLNGDSHVYRSDNPLSQTGACTGDATVCSHYNAWTAHPYYNVPNFHRIVVHGSTFPLEWLKLTIDPNANHKTTATTFGPFAWQRMTQLRRGLGNIRCGRLCAVVTGASRHLLRGSADANSTPASGGGHRVH
jgi:hypothetical protein